MEKISQASIRIDRPASTSAGKTVQTTMSRGLNHPARRGHKRVAKASNTPKTRNITRSISVNLCRNEIYGSMLKCNEYSAATP